MQVSDRIKEIRTVKASDILPNPKNWRTHPEEQKNAMMGAFAEIGNIDVLKCVETEKGLMLIDGHLRTDILGESEVKVAVLDLTVDEANKALATFDPIALSAKADEEKLSSLLGEIEFESDAIEEMLEGLDLTAGFGGGIKDGLTDPDDVPEPPADPITQPGDLWILGEHRVLCGDSTKREDVERLMDGAKADVVIADPPYGIDANQQTLGTGKKEFHRGGDWDSERLPVAWLLDVAPVAIIWGGNYFADELPPTNDWLCWHKKNDGLSFSEFELAWTNTGRNCRHLSHHWSGEVKAHPTQKPVAVIAWCVQMTEGLIVDFYLGSGTTLIAAEQLGRKCYGMEISPQYCDVIVKRWEEFTGNKAELAE